MDTKEKLKLFLWIMIIAYADLAFVSRYYDVVTPYYWINRNNFAFSLVGIITFPIWFAMAKTDKLRKVEALLYLVLILYAIIASNSRGAYLGLIVIFVLVILIDFKMKKLFFIAIPIVAVLARISSHHWARLATVSLDVEQTGTAGQRLASWGTGIRMMMTNPIFGVGSGESGPQFSNYATIDEMLKVGGEVGKETMKLHNMTIQIGAEMGIVGLGLFLFITLLGLRYIWQVRKLCMRNDNLLHLKYMADGLGIALMGVLVAGQFGNYGYNIQFYTLICTAYCLKEITLREHRRITEEQPVVEEPIIPVKWEVPVRAIVFCIFTYMSLKL